MQLTKHFSLEELTISQAAERSGISNQPTPEILDNLTYTSTQMELVRDLLGTPINVNSAYRSPEVNKLVKGAKNSQHVEGKAVDFISPSFGTPRQIVEKIKGSNIVYDQLIHEFNSWVHISFTKHGSRRQTLIIDSNGTRTF